MTQSTKNQENISFCSANVTHAKFTKSGSRLRLVEIAPFDPNAQMGFKKYTSKKQRKLKCGRFESSLIRSRSKVQEHILNNFPPKQSIFITLTYRENFTKDKYDESLKHFDLFIKKMRYKYKNIKYLAVAELQKRGAIHYHIVINRKTIDSKWLLSAWDYGFVFTKITYGKPIKVAYYLSKYLTKDLFVPFSRKSYLSSKNLKKSIVISGIFEAYSYLMKELNAYCVQSVDNLFVFKTSYAKIRISDYYIPT